MFCNVYFLNRNKPNNQEVILRKSPTGIQSINRPSYPVTTHIIVQYYLLLHNELNQQ